jgi:AcrR family transcriptional regulator
MAETRAEQTVAAARELLEAHGWEAVTMRRIADALGIRAPSLYKHVPDKAAVEIELIALGLRELGDAVRSAPPTLAGIAGAYRAYALAHPHLYTLVTRGPLPRERLPAGVEEEAAEPLRAVVPDEDRARALWASAHGLASLEIAQRFPPGADLDAAWASMVAAYER